MERPRAKKPTAVIEFSGKRPKGKVIDGSQEILDALDEAKLQADDETRLKTLEEILCEGPRRGKREKPEATT